MIIEMFFNFSFFIHLREKNFQRLSNAQIPKIVLIEVTGCSPLLPIEG